MRLSHSRIDMFRNCKRWFWLAYIKNVPIPITDTRHLRRGSVFHEVAEYIIKEKPADVKDVQIKFLETWAKYKLDEDFKEEKDKTYLMLVNLFNNRPELTSTEYKIFTNDPEFVGYIDGINTSTDTIVDYKTSTYCDEDPYKDQLGRYSLFYWKHFNRVPKCEVLYVKYSPFKRTLYIFSTDELLKYEEEIREVNKYIEENRNNIQKFPMVKDSNHNCHVFCPYKKICESTEKELHLKLVIQNAYIYVEGEISSLLNAGLKKKFSYELKNAYWIRKNNIHANTWVRLWDEKHKRIPIGFYEGLKKTITDYTEYKNLKLCLEEDDRREYDKTELVVPEKFLTGTELRDYQKEAVEGFLKHKTGLLEIGTGGGKTEVAIELIRRLKVKTLFIVDKIELLRQTKERIEKYLGVEVGVIGQSESIIKDVTVATVQTLNKRLHEYGQYLSTVRFAIFDECHKVAANSYVKIGRRLINTEYRLGLTGTAFRDDGNDLLIYSTAGYIIHRLSAEELIAKGWLVKPRIQFYEVHNVESQEGEKYMDKYKIQIQNNSYRMNKIRIIINEFEKQNKKILILTKLIEHGDMLKQMIPESEHLYGATNKADRKQMMEDFKQGKFNILISTISIFSEGIDIPTLDVVVNAGANKGNVKTIQMLGRVLRLLEGKSEAYYIDFIDEHRMFKSASKARMKILEREGHDVKVIKNAN